MARLLLPMGRWGKCQRAVFGQGGGKRRHAFGQVERKNIVFSGGAVVTGVRRGGGYGKMRGKRSCFLTLRDGFAERRAGVGWRGVGLSGARSTEKLCRETHGRGSAQKTGDKRRAPGNDGGLATSRKTRKRRAGSEWKDIFLKGGVCVR